MKVICISSAQIPSDTANSIQVMKVCQSFVQLGHQVHLIVPGSSPADMKRKMLMAHYGLQQSFDVIWLPVRSRRWFPWRAAWQARRLGAELVYVWPLQSAVLSLLLGIPVLVELHDVPAGTFGPLWLKLLLFLPARKRLLPITASLSRLLHLPPAHTIIAPDGVDLERYDALPAPDAARKLLHLPDKMTVMCSGHLYPGRGTGLFLDLAVQFPALSFVWVGGRPEDVEEWRERTRVIGSTNVTFLGFVPNETIPLYQAAADILLMPYERVVTTSSGGDTSQVCSPMKMFEYMAAERAILTSDLPVLREVLDDTMAVFCPPGDTAAWKAALGRLVDDPSMRFGLALRAREAVTPFAWTERTRRILGDFP